jgi:hypothetical protein
VSDASTDSSVDSTTGVDAAKDVTQPDTGADASDAAKEAEAGPVAHCTGDAGEQPFPDGGMYGCPGKVFWPNRATLCANGCTVCSATTWTNDHGNVLPTYNYWTNDRLTWSGTNPGSCAVALDGGQTSCGSPPPDSGLGPTDYPVHVCVSSTVDAGVTDPLGNACFWHDCGFNVNSPDEFFGGCFNDYTAGTLCCCP